MTITTLILCSMIAFLLGAQTRKYIELFIIKHNFKNSLYEEYLRKQKECPHGHDDWGDCPDCCH